MCLHVCALLTNVAILEPSSHTPSKLNTREKSPISFEGLCEETVVFLWSGGRDEERGVVTSHLRWVGLQERVDQTQMRLSSAGQVLLYVKKSRVVLE